MLDSIRRLREMTLNLPVHPTTQGCSHAQGDGVVTADVFLPAGSASKEHAHDRLTVIVPYRGKIMAVIEAQDRVVPVGRSVYFLPGSPHYVVALVDSWVIEITIPNNTQEGQ